MAEGLATLATRPDDGVGAQWWIVVRGGLPETEQLMVMDVLGRTVDEQTRCVHYSGTTDVVAIKFKCCGSYYPCFQCHRDCVDHPPQQWPVADWDMLAILCGVCRTEHTIRTYLEVLACPHCGAQFNEGCRLHRHLYFATTEAAG